MVLIEYHYSIDKGTARSIHNPSLVHHKSIDKATKYTQAKNEEGTPTTWFSIKEAEYWWHDNTCTKCSGFGCLACNGHGFRMTEEWNS